MVFIWGNVLGLGYILVILGRGSRLCDGCFFNSLFLVFIGMLGKINKLIKYVLFDKFKGYFEYGGGGCFVWFMSDFSFIEFFCFIEIVCG